MELQTEHIIVAISVSAFELQINRLSEYFTYFAREFIGFVIFNKLSKINVNAKC